MDNIKSEEQITKIVKDLLDNPHDYANKISITELVNILKTLSYYYYNTGLTLVPDDIFDLLKSVLNDRDPTNPYLVEIGAPIIKNKVKLPSYMASLDKIKPSTDALDSWKKKYKGPYVLTDKLDGVSALFVMDGKTNKLYTRGDGEYGQDISYLIKYLIPKTVNATKILTRENPIVMIRGELIISKKKFTTIQNEMKNARNAVAGLVNSKEYSVKIAKITEFIAYSIVKPRLTQIEEMKLLEQWGFNVVKYVVQNDLTNDMLSDYLTERRKNGLYEVDGIVVNDASKAYDIEDKNPTYAFAFKTIMTDQIAEVLVLDVEWKASMHGFLKPRIRIEPVTLVGVEIKYATAFNGRFVEDNKLGPGSKIKLVRSGDVIPHILEVLTPSASGKPKMPDIPYKWNSTYVDLIVKDIHGSCNNTILTKKIAHFFKTIGVKFISEGIVTKLVDNGYDSIIKILQADHKDLANIDGIGNKLIDKIYANIKDAFTNITLIKLMAASTLFGKGFGVRRLKVIIDNYPTIMKKQWDKKTMIEKIMALEGFDTITATQFSDHFAGFKIFFKQLSEVIDLSHINKSTSKKNKQVSKTNTNKLTFDGIKVVFTGFRNKDLEEYIEHNGGTISSGVSKNTNIVVYVAATAAAGTIGTKYKKAIELNVPTMTLEEFTKKYNINI